MTPTVPGTLVVVIAAALAGPAAGPEQSRAKGREPSLSLQRDAGRLTVTSTAAPTWKVAIAVASQASREALGGGTVVALHIPASHPDSLVRPTLGKSGGGIGLGNLEWRYVDGKGIRAPLGTTASVTKLEVREQSRRRIVLALGGQWQNTAGYSAVMTIDPTGYDVDLETTWTGPVGLKAMWWLVSVFHAHAIDGDGVTITDADTPPRPLPYVRESTADIPADIAFPYVVTFPLGRPLTGSIALTVTTFGDDSPAARRYERWPAEDGYYKYFPRWVTGQGFERKPYRFRWAWRLAARG